MLYQPSLTVGIKIEHATRAFARNDSGTCDYYDDWDVDWDDVLGTGSWGKVYAAVRTGGVAPWMYARVSALGVAIKMFDKPDGPKGIRHADEEFKRCAAAGAHPNLVKLLDARFFRREQRCPRLGLVYERFDGALAQIVSLPLKWDGVQHVLQSVLAGLAHMHASGLVHTAVTPKNIFLRGAGQHRGAWARALRDGCISPDSACLDPETRRRRARLDAHLPCTFKVGGELPPVGSAPPFPPRSPGERTI